MRFFPWSRRQPHHLPAESQPATATGQDRASRFVVDDGRRYVTDAPYMLPKDTSEIGRLDRQHYMLRAARHGNYAAPLSPSIKAILDVGCGTGRWAIEMGRAFPEAAVIGLDIVPPLVENDAPETRPSERPSGVVFIRGNVLEGLPFTDQHFDLVHQRLMLGAIPSARWAEVTTELVRVTRPGGWVELIETAPITTGDPAITTLTGWGTTLSNARGIDMLIGSRIGIFLAQAGLEDIATQTIDIPMGAQGGPMGEIAIKNYFEVFMGMRGPAISMGLTTPEIFDTTLQAAYAAVEQGAYVSPYFSAIGRRPLAHLTAE